MTVRMTEFEAKIEAKLETKLVALESKLGRQTLAGGETIGEASNRQIQTLKWPYLVDPRGTSLFEGLRDPQGNHFAINAKCDCRGAVYACKGV